MSTSRFLALAFALMTLCFGSAAEAVVNGTPAPNADRRFDAVALLLTVPPGGGSCAGWVSGSCTLIAPNVVLLARHSLDIGPADPLPSPSLRTYRVRFRRSASGDSENSMYVAGTPCHGIYQELDIVQLVDAPNPSCDQVLGFFAHAPVGIRPIALEFANAPLAPANAILAGWGYSGQCFGAGDAWSLRTARGNTPGNWGGTDVFAYSPCLISPTAPCLTCFGSGPMITGNLHDSGAPILIEVPSADAADPTPELRLVATVSSPTTAHRPSAWNNAGGLPSLFTAPAAHVRTSDFDGNGQTSMVDLLAYLNAYFRGTLDADIRTNGVVDVADLFDFLNAWLAGA